MRPAVHQIGHAVRLAAGDRDGDGRVILVRTEVPRRSRRSQARQKDQLRCLPPVQRHLHDALVVDDLADAGRSRLDHCAARGHGDLFAEPADDEGDIDRRVAVDLEDDAITDVSLKSLDNDFDLIGPDRKVRYDVGAVGAGMHRARHARIGLRDGDFGSRQDPAVRVAHDPGDLRARHGLRPGRSTAQEPCESAQEKRSQQLHSGLLRHLYADTRIPSAATVAPRTDG